MTTCRISLAAARVNAGYTQREAAKKLGITNQTLCNWENGKSEPKASMIDKIGKVYNFPSDNIIFLQSKSD